MVKCLACASGSVERIGSISRLAQGNEEIYTLYRCHDCGNYLLDCYEDIFMPVNDQPDPHWTRGPFDKAKGELLGRLIKKCPDPKDKFCNCAAHVQFFDEI
ncbi:MAG: hypothetical protein Q6373_006385 [Candidatus Sigynarchaeota archaeon]